METERFEDQSKVISDRYEKLEKLKALGVNPFPYAFERDTSANDILADFNSHEGKPVVIAGRIMSLRRMGKAAFFHVMDATGKIQVYVRESDIGEKSHEAFKLFDIGDHVGVRGKVFRTHAGEITIQTEHIELLSKNLRPLPIVKEKVEDGKRVIYDAFSDVEQRYRQRYADLVVNPQVRDIFVKRSKIITTMRKFLDERGFLEVETPVLQPIYGGAAARPFTTHHNALDMTLYLRIADELYLKRLIAGGFEGVYEISKDFRNEGIDRFHNPEFTMMELYVAYQDFTFMMKLVEEMVGYIAQTVIGSHKINFQGQEIDLTPPWPRLPYFKAIENATGYNLYNQNRDELFRIARSLQVETEGSWSAGKIIDEIFSEKVEPGLVQPVFITDYPVELSPLAKRHRSDPNLVERFEPYLAGHEFGNSFSELNDPIDQKERFEAQRRLAEAGDEEAHAMDEDYLRALEYGMPPTAGLGMGVDRLVMILTDSPSIREVILFPQMRPENL